jgi:hypothetical protein
MAESWSFVRIQSINRDKVKTVCSAGAADPEIIFKGTPVYITPGVVTEDRRRRSIWLV